MRWSTWMLFFTGLASVLVTCWAIPVEDGAMDTRQTGPMCQNDSDCFPGAVAPITLIECLDNGLCSCQKCFTLNTTANVCYQEDPTCYFYNASIGQCQDERYSQAVAFYLSLALSSVGAANFYIGRNDLGGAQLAVSISLFGVLYCICYAMCCMACCIGMEKGEIVGGIISFIVIFLVVIWIIVGSFTLTAWWIADLVIFAQNDRLGGNGCPLQPNL